MAVPRGIRDALGEWYARFEEIPAGVHVLCPKESDDDGESYHDLEAPGEVWRGIREQRIERSKERIKITYWTSLLYAYDAQQGGTWLDKFTARVSHVLETCDNCIVNWHQNRAKFRDEFRA
jgi:senataxin